jgi:hypothetical protein
MIMHKLLQPLLVFSLLLSSGVVVQAQTSTTTASTGSSNYSGFGTGALSNTSVTPFRSTTQDLNAILEGNALVSQGSLLLNNLANTTSTTSSSNTSYASYAVPYIMTAVTGASSTAPLLAAPSLSLQTLMTTMGLPFGFSNSQNITNQAAANFATSITPGTTTNSAQYTMNESAASAQAAASSTPSGIYLSGSSGNVLAANATALAPYNAQTIMYPNVNNYQSNVTTTGQGSNAQQYLALVTGSIAPVTGMLLSTQFGGPNATQNFQAYQLMVAREAAVQTAAAEVLQQYAMSNAPLSISASALGDVFVNTKMVPSINNIERFMSSRRLNPNSGWYYRVAQGSSLELQRESLYLQAESLYEMNQVHQALQQQTLLLSMALIEQTRGNINMLNQGNQITAAQTGTQTTSTTSTTSSVPMATSSTSTTSTTSTMS